MDIPVMFNSWSCLGKSTEVVILWEVKGGVVLGWIVSHEIHVHLKAHNVILFVKKVFADVSI